MWARVMTCAIVELGVYEPGVEACVGSVDQEVTNELCELPVYCFECRRGGPFKQSGWIHDSAFWGFFGGGVLFC